MIQNFRVDQAATFETIMFMGCEPKTKFGTQYEQEMTKEGLGKYVAQLAARFRAFGRTQSEILNVGLSGEKDPCADLIPGTPVQLVGFEIGVMPRKNKQDEITGVSVWYRCEQIRPIASTAGTGKRAVEAVS
jgi:hypothetical protein